MKQKKELVITGEKVIDRHGNVIAERPEDIPEFAHQVKAVSETIKTGKEHKVVV